MSTAKITSRTVSNQAVAGFLAATYGWATGRAERVASIATAFESKAEATEGGFVQVTYLPETTSYLVEDHTGRDIS